MSSSRASSVTSAAAGPSQCGDERADQRREDEGEGRYDVFGRQRGDVQVEHDRQRILIAFLRNLRVFRAEKSSLVCIVIVDDEDFLPGIGGFQNGLQAFG